jgi:hypothetical protein
MMRTLGVVGVLLTLLGCSASTTDEEGGGEYDQTWSKSYGNTTCSDWTSLMTSKQQFVAAADMLTSAQQEDGASDSHLPSDDLVRDFESGIATVCEVDAAADESLAETGGTLYLTERSRFSP